MDTFEHYGPLPNPEQIIQYIIFKWLFCYEYNDMKITWIKAHLISIELLKVTNFNLASSNPS